MTDKPEDKQLVIEKIRILEAQTQLREGLPHLYGFPWYKWAWDFFQSTNKYNFLVAGNQLSKSSSQIRKCIHWATEPKLWPKLWRTRPLQFWYLYPTKEVASIEFDKKWIPEFLPRGAYKEHPQYGWRYELRNRNIFALHFNTGVSIYFKTYAQDVQHLQTSTAWAIFADEELPEDLFDEIGFRLAAADGYFHMVFTATLGQERWRRTMEETGRLELFRGAFKQRVSAYDCLYYIDGASSPWTEQRISQLKAQCKSKNEELKRVYGRFILDEGLRYSSFDRDRNIIEEVPIPIHWPVYTGIDVGGGKGSHPAAIIFVAVNPEHTLGYVFMGWRGDNEVTTASDVLRRYQEMRGSRRITQACYDHAAKDFYTIATRVGESFLPAEKSHEVGEHILNVLFKNSMLQIFGTEELMKLVTELSSNTLGDDKRKAKDDLIDALRYAVTRIPWDYSKISGFSQLEDNSGEKVLTESDQRREWVLQANKLIDANAVEAELDEWNELYES